MFILLLSSVACGEKLEAGGRSGRAAALTHLLSISAAKRSGGRRSHDRGRAASRLARDSLTSLRALILVLGIAADPSKSFISPNLLFFFSPLLYWRRGVPSLLLSSSLVLLRPRVQWTQSRPPSTSTTVKLSIVLQVSSSVLLLFNTTRSVAELRVHFLAKRLIDRQKFYDNVRVKSGVVKLI